jgi:hypothetical protein
MTPIVTTCRKCGREFEPDRATILAGSWRLCPSCRRTPPQQQPDASHHCSQCGRPLRTAGRSLCYRCLTGESGL